MRSTAVRGALLSALCLVTCLSTAPAAFAQARVNAALLPSSRYVQIGDTATAFVTIQNAGDQAANNCSFTPTTNVDSSFSVFLTNATTNQQITPTQPAANIPAGGTQTYGFAMTPNSAITPTEIEFSFDCDNTEPARVISGVNTFTLGASNDNGPDMVALAATVASDGITRTPGPFGTGVFSVATANVGGAGSVTVTPQMTDPGTSVTLRICETDTATGACLAAPAPSVTTTATANGTNSFGIFARGSGSAALAPATRRVQLAITDANGALRGRTSVAYTTQTEVAIDGGTLRFEDSEVEVATNAAWAPVDVNVDTNAPLPAALPTGTATAERTRDISVSDQTRLNAPLYMWLDYDDAQVDENNIMVLHYNESTSAYEPVTVFELDTDANRIRVDSRNFSSFVTTALNAALPTSFSVSGFNPTTDSWNIRNFGSFFSEGGNCLGMSGYTVWFNDAHSAQTLSTQYSSAGGSPISIAHLVATRAHLAQSQYWAQLAFRNLNALSDQTVANMMRAALYLTNQPVILVLGTNGRGRHATVLYGWDASGFLHYEVNTAPSGTRTATIPFANGSFGTYGAYNDFGFVAFPSLGRGEDFATLHSQAVAGFPSSNFLNISNPDQDEVITQRSTNIQGTVSGDLVGSGRVVAYLNGPDAVELGLNVSSFSRTMPIKNGENTLIVLAGLPDGNLSLWGADAATLVRTFEGDVEPSGFRSTLTWTHTGDVDLYVTEPTGATSWYGGRTTSNGMTLDFDNTSAYGPENTTVGEDEGDIIESGEYQIRVHYYRGDGPSTGSVQVMINENEPDQVNQTFNFRINSNGSSSTAGPGGSGPQWVCCIYADVENGTIR